ncbi:MAG: adenylate/guanylate cyclase domain-containing protein [Opitutaceae bacterium]|nr:adenylate/guanylate cyclase domain-containing protein [Verrucomicrobiales bacterium]
MPPHVKIEAFFEIPFPRSELWPLLSKTDWINRLMGLPPVDYEMSPLPQGGSLVTARCRMLGSQMVWTENPFEWSEPEYYRVHRVFQSGPFLEAWMGIEFHDMGEGRCRLRAFSDLTPRHALGSFLARFVLAGKARRDMARLIAYVEVHLRGEHRLVMPKLPVRPPTEASMESGLRKLRAFGEPPDRMALLERLLREAPDTEVAGLRPFALAREWTLDRWDVLRLFLHATRSGLLTFSWEVLCPNCRSTREPLKTSLAQLHNQVHCDVCQIRYDGEFDQSVELKFSVHPSVRRVDRATYCLGGPGGRPHIVSQLRLKAHERRTWTLPELKGRMRLRSPQVKKSLPLGQRREAGSKSVIVCNPESFDGGDMGDTGGGSTVEVVNPSDYEILLVLERVDANDDILTAAEVTNWQDFRDLFATEVISPEEQIHVGQQVVLFTDLRGSTAMYCGIGDAPAYAVVRDHFKALSEAIRAQHGTIVKTIGDAVMAVFSRVDEALAAVRAMHLAVSGANPSLEDDDTAMLVRRMQSSLADLSVPGHRPALRLKSSLHLGPCLAVNANDRLDYFGSTINLAARLVDCCYGNDLVVSDDLFQCPETQRFLDSCQLRAEPGEATFRGFQDTLKIWRIRMVSSAGNSAL